MIRTLHQSSTRTLLNYFMPLIAAVALLAATPVQAAEDGSEICRTIVDKQIRAFMAKDHEGAYAFAAPVIKSMYPTAEAFVTMVKRGYPAVYEPQTYSFGRSTMRDGQIMQEVLLTDKQNRNWIAIYSLNDFGDGDWRITGVFLQRSSAQPT